MLSQTFHTFLVDNDDQFTAVHGRVFKLLAKHKRPDLKGEEFLAQWLGTTENVVQFI